MQAQFALMLIVDTDIAERDLEKALEKAKTLTVTDLVETKADVSLVDYNFKVVGVYDDWKVEI